MDIQGDMQVLAAPQTVWEIINDPKCMQDCMPGCRGLEAAGDGAYRTALEIGVGAMTGSFDAALRLSRKVPPQGYRLDVDAKGIAGDVHGGGTVSLEPSSGGTLLRYQAHIEVTGVIALMGEWMLRPVVNHLAAEFFDRLGRIAQARQHPAAAD